MKKVLLGSSALAVVAGAAFLTYSAALAASPDDLDREKAQLRKENADLREMLRMHDQNSALRARLQARDGAAATPTRTPTEIAHGLPAGSLNNLYDADMAAPVYKAAPPLAYYNWTGFYFGGNVGYGVGEDPIGQVLSSSAGATDTNFTRTVVAPKGVIGGVQFGYNVQSQSWLAGVEFDFQGSGQQDKACAITCSIVNTPGGTTQQTLNVEQKLQYFGTARARIGAVDNNVLYYVTGGGAYGRVSETANVIFNLPGTGATSASNEITDNRFGWVVGAGIEAGLWGNWTAKVEYLYMDLGHLAANNVGFALPGITATVTTNSSIRDNIVRAGVNYRLGPEATGGGLYDRAPVAALPQYHWTGFYVGGNFGYAQAVDRLAQTASGTGLGGTISTSDDSVITPKGFAGGLQLGYNLQGGGNWLAGFEADIQGTTQNDTTCAPYSCYSQTLAGGGGGNFALFAKQSIDYFATIRGRVGLVNNNVLYYGTGGAALGHVNETVGINFTVGTPAAFDTSKTSADMIGWVAGGGIEAAMWGNWTAKAEYLYMDLGNMTNTLAIPSLAGTFTTTSTVKDHIFRAGVNYHL
jgi:outer membrane immunogenic protein